MHKTRKNNVSKALSVSATRRSRRRSAKKLLLVLLFLGAAWYGWRWLCNAQRFPIRHAQVEASFEHMDQPAYQTVIAPFLSEGFFGINIKVLKQKLYQLPWVADVSVRRMWPDAVKVSVVEKEPVAVWNQKQLITADDVLFSPEDQQLVEAAKKLPQLTGPVGEEARIMSTYVALREALKPIGLDMTGLSCESDGFWIMQIGELSVTIGNLAPPDLLTRVQQFARFYPAFAEHRKYHHAKIRHIDLRYPDGFAASA